MSKGAVMENMFLDRNEIADLTGKKLRHKQKIALDVMGITYKETPDGKLKILRDHVKREFGLVDNMVKIEREYSPNWEMMNA